MMLLAPEELREDLDRLEDIEKSSLRLVVQAVLDFRTQATEIFRMENDLVQDIGEPGCGRSWICLEYRSIRPCNRKEDCKNGTLDSLGPRSQNKR